MPKFAIAFVVPESQKAIRHRIIEGSDQDAALSVFFKEELTDLYSDDDRGRYYFKEDFFDSTSPSGSILLCD
jgi:hypothetical protein